MENLLKLSRRVAFQISRSSSSQRIGTSSSSSSSTTPRSYGNFAISPTTPTSAYLPIFIRPYSSSESQKKKTKLQQSQDETLHSHQEKDVATAESQDQHDDDSDIARRSSSHLKERRKILTTSSDDLVPKKSDLEQAKERRRYEIDLPPVEEERHKYWKSRPLRSVNKNLIRTDLFENIKDKNKDSFMAAVEIFSQRDIHLRGHVEFIYAALSQMVKFGLHRDLEAYKKIIDIFPKGKMISSNMFQVEFMHYPKQQQCGVDILEQMENYGVCPDSEVQQMFTNIFGSQSFPMRKAGRMLYWMPKFRNLSPWLLPDPLPDDCLDLAKLAIKRITSVDLSTTISVFHADELEDATDPTWIVSGQSQEQQSLINSHPPNQPIYVEGAFRVWLTRTCINYFILRAEPKPRPPPPPSDVDDVSKLHSIFGEEYEAHQVEPVPSVHEQDDGIILGVCATGTSSRDSVVSWIQFLVRSNPRLGTDIPILFTLKSPLGPVDDLEIPSFEEAEKLKLLGGGGDESSFSVGSGGKLGLDPRLPNLKQMGIWTESESVFPNWPHHHHPQDSESRRNLESNLGLVDELEEHIGLRRKGQLVNQDGSLASQDEDVDEDGKKQLK